MRENFGCSIFIEGSISGKLFYKGVAFRVQFSKDNFPRAISYTPAFYHVTKRDERAQELFLCDSETELGISPNASFC